MSFDVIEVLSIFVVAPTVFIGLNVAYSAFCKRKANKKFKPIEEASKQWAEESLKVRLEVEKKKMPAFLEVRLINGEARLVKNFVPYGYVVESGRGYHGDQPNTCRVEFKTARAYAEERASRIKDFGLELDNNYFPPSSIWKVAVYGGDEIIEAEAQSIMATRKFKRRPETIQVLEVLATNKNEQANFLPSGYLEQTEWSIDRDGNVKAIIIGGNCHKVGSLLVKRGTNSVTVNTIGELLVDFDEVT